MSANNLTVDEIATKKIRELTESEELRGYMPIDSSVFGTKKFAVEKLSLKTEVTAAVTDLSSQITALNTRVTVNGEQITMLKSKLRGALILKDELTVAQVAAMDLSTVEAGWMYTITDGGTITYVYKGATKNLKVEQYDEVAWSENSGWIIVGKDKSVDLTPYTPTAELAAVALSNDYNDLTNKPNIPAAQVQSDWNQDVSSAIDFIKNKPNLAAVALSGLYSDLTGIPSFATVATSGDYDDLTNKPLIGTGVLTIQKNGVDIDTFGANASANKTININIPTKVSDLQNDSRFATESQLPTKTSDLTNDSGFLTLNDLPAYPSKTSDLTNDSGFITASALPTKVSDLTNDSGFITASDIPTIPSKTSDLQNDSNFITLSDIPTASVYDDGLMPATDHSKLQGIESGAQVNVKPDWNAAAGTDAEILNKPTIPTKTQKVTVSGTLSSGTLSFTVTEGSFAVLDPGANTSAGTIAINFVNASGRGANDLFEAAFEIDLSVFSNRESLAINFSKNGNALDAAHVGNKPEDMTAVKILMGVIANDVLFLNETETSN